MLKNISSAKKSAYSGDFKHHQAFRALDKYVLVHTTGCTKN